MNQLQINQFGQKKQRLYPGGLPITLDLDEPGGPVKNIEPPIESGYSKELDKIFKEFFPALFQKEVCNGK